MPPLRPLLKRLLALVVGASLIWVLALERVGEAHLVGSAFYDASVEALEAALRPAPPASAGSLEAGGARIEIAPPIDWNVPLGGNRRLRFARAEGKRPESVWARALALRQANRSFILVSADIMVVHPGLGEAVLERIQRDVPIDRHQLMLVAAHTHSGPGGYWEGLLAESSLGPYQQRLFDLLVERLSTAAIEAWSDLQPATAGFGSVDLELPVKNRARLDGPENSRLGLLRFEALADDRGVELVNYSAHPTNILRGNRLLTGDYPALLAQMVEQDREDATLVFTPGTIGDQKPWYHREKDSLVKASGIAETLYAEGLAVIEPRPLDDPILETFEFEVTMPPFQPRVIRSDRLGSWALRGWLAGRLFPAHLNRTVIQAARIGPVALIGAPSDLSTSLAEPLLERASALGLDVLFVSMAEDWIGYVMTGDEYRGVSYKETSQFHGPLSGPLFLDLYTRLIEGLAGRASADPTRSRAAEIRAVPAGP